MTLTERKIWHLPLILLLVFWLGGCSMQYEGDEPQLQTGDLNLILNIHTGDANNGLTRAEIDENFEQATLDRELMQTLRVIIVNQYNGIIVHKDFINLQNATSIDGLKYKVDFETKYKVYLIANEYGIPNYNQIFSEIKVGQQYEKDYLENQVIEIAEAGKPIINASQSDLPVPMTEIFEITTEKPKQLTVSNEVIQEETFFITRAASKFSFYFFKADDLELLESTENQCEIKSIRIGGLGKNEYLFPNETDYFPEKKDRNDRNNDNRDITSFKIPNQENGTGDFTFELQTPFKLKDLPTKSPNFNIKNPTAGLSESGIKKHVPLIYFPESKGNESGDLDCTISFDGENYLPAVRLPNLPYKLPRNTHVVVIITVNATSIDVVVDVQPFAQVDLNPDFGLTRDENGNILVRDKNGKLIKIIPYDSTITPSLRDVEIGDMRYVEVAYNDVIKFREFVDENGVPDGRRQDFLTSGWNIYSKEGNMTSCFIYETEMEPNATVTAPQSGKYMEFDNLSNLILEYDGCIESSDRTSCDKSTGEKVVWAKAAVKNPDSGEEEEIEIDNSYFNNKESVDDIPDSYKIYYKSYDGGQTAMQTILVVYEVKNEKKTNKILTVFTEEGDVNFEKTYVNITSDVIGQQEGVKISQVENGKAPITKYCFFNNGAYQVYYLYSSVDANPLVYDWDYYHEDGYRFSSFDNSHPRYNNKNVYSQYDKWGNVTSRSIEAEDKSETADTSHNRKYMVIDNDILSNDTVINETECKKGDMIIKYRKRKPNSNEFYWGDDDWTPTYCVSPDGTKKVLIS